MKANSSQSNPWIYGGLSGILGLIPIIMVYYFGLAMPTPLILGVAYLSLIAFVWNRNFSSNPRFLLGLIAGPVLLIGVGFVAGYGIIQTDLLSSVQALELEKMVGLKLPARTTGLHSSIDGFMDTSLHARFEMPKADYPEFLRVNKLETDGSKLLFDDDAMGRYWWKPESLVNPQNLLKTGPQTGTLEKRYTLDLLAGDAEEEKITVYLRIFGN